MRLSHVVFAGTTAALTVGSGAQAQASAGASSLANGMSRGLAATGASVVGVIVVGILAVLAGIYFIWRSRS